MKGERPLMACGHVANGRGPKGQPVCVICFGLTAGAETPIEVPSFEGRMAECVCGNRAPSSLELAFFEFRGEGSPAASRCTCGYGRQAHARERVARSCPTGYEPRGALETDSYYCGCRGWD